MAASNIERFDELTGQILADLYAEFPMGARLATSKFVTTPYGVDRFTGAEVASDEAKFFNATVEWLADAGYLRYFDKDPTGVSGFSGVVLTAKGLELLKAIPDSLGGSFGDRLREAAATEGREGLRSLVSQVLSTGISLLSS